MPIEFSCPTCARKLRAPDTATGRVLRCPKCNGAIIAPSQPATAPERQGSATRNIQSPQIPPPLAKTSAAELRETVPDKAHPSSPCVSIRDVVGGALRDFGQNAGVLILHTLSCFLMGLLFAALLGWCLMLGHWMGLNSIGVAHRFAPRLTKGEKWGDLWSRGAWTTCSDFQLGGAFVVSFFLLFLGGTFLVGLVGLLFAEASTLIGGHSEPLILVGIIGATIAVLYIHARLTFLTFLPPDRASITQCWRAPAGNVRAVFAITAFKWLLTCASFLLAGLPFLVVIPYCGLLNDRIRGQLLGHISDATNKSVSSGTPLPNGQ